MTIAQCRNSFCRLWLFLLCFSFVVLYSFFCGILSIIYMTLKTMCVNRMGRKVTTHLIHSTPRCRRPNLHFLLLFRFFSFYIAFYRQIQAHSSSVLSNVNIILNSFIVSRIENYSNFNFSLS